MPPTPQLVKRGSGSYLYRPMEAGMIAGFLWFQGAFLQFWYYTSLFLGVSEEEMTVRILKVR